MPAIIFDCDGVLADTERFGHLIAFNQTFRELGLPIQWSEDDYAIKLKIAGGKERMASLLNPEFVKQLDLPTDSSAQKKLISNWHKIKTEIYMEMVTKDKLPERPGIVRLVKEAIDAGWKLAVASTSSNISGIKKALDLTLRLSFIWLPRTGSNRRPNDPGKYSTLINN